MFWHMLAAGLLLQLLDVELASKVTQLPPAAVTEEAVLEGVPLTAPLASRRGGQPPLVQPGPGN